MPLTISRTIDVKQKLGRNDPCYCGSGKKYKKCHLRTDEIYAPEKKTGTLSRISEFLIKQQFFKDLMNKVTIDIYGKGEIEMEGEEEFGAIIDAVIFAGKYKGESPFAYFLNHAPLSSTEKQMYAEWLIRTHFSLFEVKNVMIGKKLEVMDLFTKKNYVIYERLGTYQLQPGMAVTGRIVPFADQWMFTGGGNIQFTPEMVYALKRKIKHTNDNEQIDQLEAVKYIYSKQNSENPEELSDTEALKKLQDEIGKRNIDLPIDKIKKATDTQDNLQDIYNLLGKAATSEDDLEYLVNLFFKATRTFKQTSGELGPQEKLLMRTFMEEAQHEVIDKTKNFDTLSQKDRQKHIDIFADLWFTTPQQELGKKTPKDIIAKEREKLGLPPANYRHSITATPLPNPLEKFDSSYNEAVDLMRSYQYVESLEILTNLYPHLDTMDNSFRWWFNTGSCIANLGEEDLAKRYYEKALKMNPHYTHARQNLAAFQNQETLHSLHLGGKQRLFEAILQKGIECDCHEIKNNELLRDFHVFLSYFSNYGITPTKTRRDIPLADIITMNRQFVHPDPEEVVIRAERKKFHSEYREEGQFPKITFLHTLCLQGKLLKYTKKQFVVTQEGKTLLQDKPQERYGKLLSLWLSESDWTKLDRPRKGALAEIADKFNNPVIETLQATTYQMLHNIKVYANKDVDYEKLVEGVFKKTTDDLLFRSMSSILLDRIFVQYLIWSGIAESKSISLPKKGAWVSKDFLPLRFPLRISPFGKCVVEIIEQNMYNAIPSILRTIV